MANDFNDVASQLQVIATAYDSMTIKPLRPMYIFDGIAQEKVWNLSSMPARGDKMSFPVLAALSSNTAALKPTVATISGSQTTSYTRRTVELELYGDHAVVETLQYPAESFIDVMTDVAFQMRDQGANSINKVARQVMDLNKFSDETSGGISSTYHYYGSQGTVGNIGPLRAIDVRCIVSDLKGSNVMPFEDGNYIGIVNPVQSTQIRADSDNASWRTAVVAGDASVQRVFNGEIGVFENVRFVVNNEVLGGGSNTITAYFAGKEAVGKAIGFDLRVRPKSTLDGPHENIATMFWDALVGYRVIRRDALRTIETSGAKK